MIHFINKYTCTPQQLKSVIYKLHKLNTPPMIDFISEYSNYKNYEEIKEKMEIYPNNYFSIKLSSLGIKISENKCANQLEQLIETAKKYNNTILIDAENHEIQERIDALTDYYVSLYNIQSPMIYKTYQMYKKNAITKLKEDLQYTRNYKIGVKLVRGAYISQDKKLNVLCNSENEVHEQYDNGIHQFIKDHQEGDKLLCATHNIRSTFLARNYIKNHNLTNIEFAQLYGMRDCMTQELENSGFKVYKYLPYGNFYESIPYLLRRLHENNSMIKYLIY